MLTLSAVTPSNWSGQSGEPGFFFRSKIDGCVSRPLHEPGVRGLRDWRDTAEQPASALHLAHPEGCAALHIVLVTVPRVSRSCEKNPEVLGHRPGGMPPPPPGPRARAIDCTCLRVHAVRES